MKILIPPNLGYVWRQHVPLKWWFISTRLYSVTFRKVAVIVVINIRTSDINPYSTNVDNMATSYQC